jgi:hypothetical protein
MSDRSTIFAFSSGRPPAAIAVVRDQLEELARPEAIRLDLRKSLAD